MADPWSMSFISILSLNFTLMSNYEVIVFNKVFLTGMILYDKYFLHFGPASLRASLSGFLPSL